MIQKQIIKLLDSCFSLHGYQIKINGPPWSVRGPWTVHVSLICIELVVISICASTCFIFVTKLFYIINHAISLKNVNTSQFPVRSRLRSGLEITI